MAVSVVTILFRHVAAATRGRCRLGMEHKSMGDEFTEMPTESGGSTLQGAAGGSGPTPRSRMPYNNAIMARTTQALSPCLRAIFDCAQYMLRNEDSVARQYSSFQSR